MATDTTLDAGRVLDGRYRLRELLGKGGMGQVYLADDLETGEQIALKSLQDVEDATDRRRFEREIRALKTLEHPNIVALRDLGGADDLLFYTMEYHPCVSLEEVIEARGGVTESHELDWYLRVLLQITSALGYLHERHFVHRDVKPANILLRIPGLVDDLPPAAEWIGFDNVIAFLTDFGLVKARDGDGSLTRTALGTPQYMSPEQIEASPAVDERTDLYSLGVMLHRIATGSLPFQSLSAALSKSPAPSIRECNPELPELLESTISRLLEFEPFRRPADARELEQLLQAVLDRKAPATTGVRATKLAQPSFCGRTAELRTLKKRVSEAARGVGSWVVIQGERGIGKSWLVHRSDLKSHALVQEQVSCFTGSFKSHTPHTAYAGLLQAVLRHIERHDGTEAAVEVLGPHGGLIDRLISAPPFADLLRETPPVDAIPAEFIRDHVIDTVVAVLTARAEVEPRLLVLEDVHYATPLDVEILRRLLLASIELPMTVITTWRPDARTRVPQLEPLLHEFRSEDRLTEIEIGPFSGVEVGQMVGSLLLPARGIASEFVQVLSERTHGVPLYVLHTINSLWKLGAIQRAETSWTVDPDEVRGLPIPESTRSHFQLVLNEVPAEELRVLNLAAVLGLEFSFEVLHAMADLDEFELDTLCRNLVHAGILEERQHGFRFAHSFEQEILLERLSKPMRTRLHARAGRLLESRHSDDLDTYAAAIGTHLFHGGESASAFEYLVHAARRSERGYAPSVALDFYEKALQCAPDNRERRSLLVAMATLEESRGESAAARAHFDEALRLFRPVEEALTNGTEIDADRRDEFASFADLHTKLGDFFGKSGETARALQSFEQASEIARRVGDNASLAYAAMRKGTVLFVGDQLEASERALKESVTLYQDLAPSSGMVSALNGLSLVSGFRGDLDGALEFARRALGIAEEVGDRARAAGLLSTIGTTHQRRGQLEEAVTAFQQACDARQELGDKRGLAASLGNLGNAHVARGDFRKGLTFQERARQICREIGDTKMALQISGNLGWLQLVRGRFHEANEILEEYLTEFRRLGAQRFVADAQVKLGCLRLEQGRLDLAETLISEGLQASTEAGYDNEAQAARVYLARVHGRKGDHDRAESICRDVIERLNEASTDEARGEALRVLAEARFARDDPEGAEEAALEALQVFESLNLPYDVGRTCRTLGKIYRELGFYWADQTGKFLERALDIFERLESRHAFALTQLEYGSFLVLMEEIDPARECFEQALPVFEELGPLDKVERTRRELEEIK